MPCSTELLKALVGERGMFTAVGDDDQIHLRLARRDRGNLGACRPTTRRSGHPAGAELPLHRRHPARGQQRHRQQPQDLREALEQYGDGDRSRCWVRWRRAEAERRRASRRCAATAKAPNFSDFAILYRANHQARVFEQALRRASSLGLRRPELLRPRRIRDLCAWLLLAGQSGRRPHASCAPSRRPSAASVTRRWARWASSRPSGSAACSRRSLPVAQLRALDPRHRLAARVWPLRERPGVPRPARRGHGPPVRS